MAHENKELETIEAAPAGDEPEIVWLEMPNGSVHSFEKGSVWHGYALKEGGKPTKAPKAAKPKGG